MSTPEDQFKSAIVAAGLEPPDTIVADGRIHRFDPGVGNAKRSGWYVLHLDGVAAGAFGDWRHSDQVHSWCSKSRDRMSEAERQTFKEQVRLIRAQRDAETARRQEEARQLARTQWTQAKPADPQHPYLVNKGIGPHGLRQTADLLLVPLHDASGDGGLQSLQTISTTGEKRFQTGGRVAGCYFPIGRLNGPLVICEGYATGASIHESTSHAVAVALSAGNLLPVAQAMRARYPDTALILAADDDVNTEGNPGITRATEAAKAVGALLAVPSFGSDRTKDMTDFNDLHKLAGLEAVRKSIQQAKAPGVVDGEVDGSGDGEVDSSADRLAIDRVVLVNGADLTPQPVRWLWPGWLSQGKLHLLAGAPGQGKTTLALAMAATVTIGGRWPDGERCEAGNVLIWSGEDDAADTLLPRLAASGADRGRCYFITEAVRDGIATPFDPARDMRQLKTAIDGIGGVNLLIVDPVVNAVTGDSHKNTEVRRALQPLVDLADACGCALLGITHLAKGGQGVDPAMRVIGSIAFTAVARTVMVAAKVKGTDGEDTRILARGKSNIGPDDGGFEYSLTQGEPFPGIQASFVAWGRPVQGTARELLAEPESDDDAAEAHDLQGFLRGILADGPLTAKEVFKDADGAGYSKHQIHRASQKMGIEKRKDGMGGGWKWALPSGDEGSAEDCTKAPKIPKIAGFENVRSSGSSCNLRGPDDEAWAPPTSEDCTSAPNIARFKTVQSSESSGSSCNLREAGDGDKEVI